MVIKKYTFCATCGSARIAQQQRLLSHCPSIKVNEDILVRYVVCHVKCLFGEDDLQF